MIAPVRQSKKRWKSLRKQPQLRSFAPAYVPYVNTHHIQVREEAAVEGAWTFFGDCAFAVGSAVDAVADAMDKVSKALAGIKRVNAETRERERLAQEREAAKPGVHLLWWYVRGPYERNKYEFRDLGTHITCSCEEFNGKECRHLRQWGQSMARRGKDYLKGIL